MTFCGITITDDIGSAIGLDLDSWLSGSDIWSTEKVITIGFLIAKIQYLEYQKVHQDEILGSEDLLLGAPRLSSRSDSWLSRSDIWCTKKVITMRFLGVKICCLGPQTCHHDQMSSVRCKGEDTIFY